MKVQQIKLELVGHMAKLMGHVLVVVMLAFLGLFFVLFLSFALGALLNELLQSAYWGYFIVAGAYFLVFIIIALLAKSGHIQRWIEAAILKASDQIETEDE